MLAKRSSCAPRRMTRTAANPSDDRVSPNASTQRLTTEGPVPQTEAAMPASLPRRFALAVRRWLGSRLSRYLCEPVPGLHRTATDPNKLMACLQPGDVLLVEGQSRISVAIKYLTQSTWSHAALYTGREAGAPDAQGL